MTDFRYESRNLESRLIYPPPPGEHDALHTVEVHEEEGGIKDTVADAAATVGETASGAASTVGDKAGDAASSIGDATSDAASAVGDAATRAAGTVTDAAPSRQQLKRGANQVAQLAQESPFGLVITGACVGFLTGMLLPTTVVDEKMGPFAEQVVDQARVAGHSAVEQGKHAMQEAAPAVGAALKG